jgi:Holliday junction DNA helicase RuvA
LLSKHPPELLLDVMGVGYEVEAPMSTFYQLPEVGEDVVLHTHLVVREDAQLLYGFYSLAERRMFRSLIRINGVGPKLALTILSGISADEFSRAIFDNDVAALTRLPGVGKKTAERLVVELRDKLDAGFMPSTGAQSGAGPASAEASNPVSDAVSALIALGYKAPEASRMVRAIDAADLAAEEIIRSALQAAARHA